MNTELIEQKQQAHLLLDLLAPEKLSAIVGVLQVMVSPSARAVALAPIDEEPITEEEAQSLQQARDWLKYNEGVPHEQVLAELGITEEEIENYREPA